MSNGTPTPPAVSSPRFSFRGWLLTTELKENAAFFKNLLNVDATVLGIGQLAPGQLPVITQHTLLILGTSVLVAVLKIAFDACHYFFTVQVTPSS